MVMRVLPIWVRRFFVYAQDRYILAGGDDGWGARRQVYSSWPKRLIALIGATTLVGSRAELLEPQAWRKQMREELEQMLASYPLNNL